MSERGKAHYVKHITLDAVGSQILYRLEGGPMASLGHVLVSATRKGGTCETYIFHANEAGEILEYSELAGSLRGALHPALALAGAGYDMISPMPGEAKNEHQAPALNAPDYEQFLSDATAAYLEKGGLEPTEETLRRLSMSLAEAGADWARRYAGTKRIDFYTQLLLAAQRSGEEG